MKTTRRQPIVSEQIVAFADLAGFHREICSKLSAEATFVFLSDYYSVAQRAVEGSDGKIIKFIGDAILFLFPAGSPHEVVETLRKLKAALDLFLSQAGHSSHVCIRAHVGEVAVGPIGTGESERIDVCGVAINCAALLPQGEWVLSEELRQRSAL